MAPPHGGEAISTINFSKPPLIRRSNDNLFRTKSDMSFDLSKEDITMDLPAISEVEDAKCECCGMSEECTAEYIEKIRSKYLGKWICGLCSEAVKEEKEKIGGGMEEALSAHMNACSRFNKYGRAYPVLYQAEAMREMFKKNTRRAISFGAKGAPKNNGGIARSSSCIAAITRDMIN